MTTENENNNEECCTGGDTCCCGTEEFKQYLQAVATAKSEYSDFQRKGNKSAGTRARGAIQESVKLAKVVRAQIQEQKTAV